jgi:hypothetical protein
VLLRCRRTCDLKITCNAIRSFLCHCMYAGINKQTQHSNYWTYWTHWTHAWIDIKYIWLITVPMSWSAGALFLHPWSSHVTVLAPPIFSCHCPCTPDLLMSLFLHPWSSHVTVLAPLIFSCHCPCTPDLLMSLFLHPWSSHVTACMHVVGISGINFSAVRLESKDVLCILCA